MSGAYAAVVDGIGYGVSLGTPTDVGLAASFANDAKTASGAAAGFAGAAAGSAAAAAAAVAFASAQVLSMGFGPGTPLLVVRARADDAGKATWFRTADTGEYDLTPSGFAKVSTQSDVAAAIAAAIGAIPAPTVQTQPVASVLSMGFLPGTMSQVASVSAGDDGKPGLASSTDQRAWQPTTAGIFVLQGGATTAAFVEPASMDFGGPAIQIGPATIPQGAAPALSVPLTNLTSPATGTEAMTEAVPASASSQVLKYETILAPTVAWSDNSTPAPVAETDYHLDTSRGLITNNSTSKAISLSYTGSKQVMEVIGVDPVTLTVSVTRGSEYQRAAEARAPTLPAGLKQLGRVFRTGASSVVIPTWRFENFVRVDRRADHEDWMSRMRLLMPATLRALRRGTPLAIFFYGDSRLAGGGTGTNVITVYNSNANPTSPQTPYSHDAGPITDPRMWDQASNGLVNIDGPWVQGDTAHALDFGDGFGAYHSREGFGWAFVKALAAFHGATFGVGGQTIQVFNMAIGGTTAQNTLNTQGRANALYPDRINALTGYIQAQVALGKTVLVLDGFGTNDVGGSYVYANQLQLFGLYKAAGAEVLKITCGRPDTRYQPDPTAWYKCVADNVRAAKDAGVAYFDTTEILSSAMLPALGLADQQVCSGNLLNHESAAVWRAIGQAAAAPLLA